MYISYDKYGIIRVISATPFRVSGHTIIEVSDATGYVIGERIPKSPSPSSDKLRVAVICNWKDRCGISTYTEMLVNSLRPKVQDIKIFSEYGENSEQDEKENVVRCWKRGESMIQAVDQILNWNPDIITIQHEFGLFPKATHFLKMIEMLDNTPYAITMHSVYEHLDKTVCTGYIHNMIVHSQQAKQSLLKHGHLNDVYVIYHGCLEQKTTTELWNIFQEEYSIITCGFGFTYKGIETAISAVAHLKKTQKKFENIFYCYLCTESPHTRTIQQSYYEYLRNKVIELGLDKNVVIMRGFLSEEIMHNFLRTAKLAIFPYQNNPKNIVFGASGAIRHALACGTPVIASDCHHFDDLEGVVPRAKDYLDLAREIDKMFADEQYRKQVVSQSLEFIRQNNWDITADKYLSVFQQIIDK